MQRNAALVWLACCAALFGGLNAVIDGIAQHVHQRPQQAAQQRGVHAHRVTVKLQACAFARALGGDVHGAFGAGAQAACAAHTGLQNLVLQGLHGLGVCLLRQGPALQLFMHAPSQQLPVLGGFLQAKPLRLPGMKGVQL